MSITRIHAKFMFAICVRARYQLRTISTGDNGSAMSENAVIRPITGSASERENLLHNGSSSSDSFDEIPTPPRDR